MKQGDRILDSDDEGEIDHTDKISGFKNLWMPKSPMNFLKLKN